jgi:hypothetical protein
VPRFHEELREYLKTEGGVYDAIEETGDLDDEATERLNAELEKFKKSFNVEDEHSLV